MKKNRIVIFGWADSVHVQRWCEGLSRRGYEIKLISVGGTPLDTVETVIFPRRNQFSYLKCLPAAKKEALKFSPDLIHAHYVAGNGLLAVWSGIKPLVASVWGADIIDLSGWPFHRWVINSVLKKATHITATSEFLKKAAVALNPIVAGKISIIPFGVEVPDEIEPLPPHRPFKLCLVKSLRPKYGPDILLSALYEVKKQIPDIQLTMAGDGPMKERLEWIIKELGLERNVTLSGFVPNQAVYNLIRQHHAMVMPSIMDSESFGVAAVEAGACARPVIASRVGGVPEVIVDGQTGILVPPKNHLALAEAIIKLASDDNLCDKMGREGYAFVREHYQWEKSLDSMCELYERVIYDSCQSKN